MLKRTTIELDVELLDRAKRSLGCRTTRATVETALRHAVAAGESERDERARRQRAYLDRLPALTDSEVLVGEEMWR